MFSLPIITVLYDNRCDNTNLKNGFGFSCMIEWENRKMLFDSGGDYSAFLENIKKLNIPLNQITHIFFSHHHWDHTAGIDQILHEVSENVAIYLPTKFSNNLEKKIPQKSKVRKIKNFEKIDDDLFSLVLGCRYMLSKLYEQSIILKTNKGSIIITGCAHPGIIRIIQRARSSFGKVYMVLGGFHLANKWSSSSAKIVSKFQDLDVEKVAPCHCAGDTAITQFEKAYGSNFIKVGTGTIIRV